jgi:hypothetical protein
MVLGLEQYLLMSGPRGRALKELAIAWPLIRLASARIKCCQNTGGNFPTFKIKISWAYFLGITGLWSILG